MEGLPEAVTNLARALRPQGLWYGAVCTLVAVLIWGYHEVPFQNWPVPFRCFVWTWLVSTVITVPYLHITGFFEARLATRQALSGPPPGGPSLSPIPPLPALPPPQSPTAGSAGSTPGT